MPYDANEPVCVIRHDDEAMHVFGQELFDDEYVPSELDERELYAGLISPFDVYGHAIALFSSS